MRAVARTDEFKNAVNHMKREGVRITSQRLHILEYLFEKKNHPTADEIYHAVESRTSNMSIATVYNNLKKFASIGLVEELPFGDACSRFELSTTPHYHVHCNECGKIVDVFCDPEFPICQTEQETNFEITSMRIELYGLCKSCQNKQEQAVSF